MSNVDWSKFKCRCSAISKALANSRSNPQLTETQAKQIEEYEARVKPPTERQKDEYARLLVLRENGKKVILSDGYIEYLMEVYAWETEGMIPVGKESLDVLSMKKGKKQEAQALALLGFYDDTVYKVHKERISNEFLSGEIDSYLGDSVYESINITDIKNAWDYPGFLKKINNGLEPGQEDQLGGYGDISGAKDLFIANCLVDTPDDIIEDMKWKVAKKFDALTIESPDFLIEWAKWERSMRFNHMSPYKRVDKIRVEPFTEAKRQKVYDRVKMGRDFLFAFDEQRRKLDRSLPIDMLATEKIAS